MYFKKVIFLSVSACLFVSPLYGDPGKNVIVDTGQVKCYNNTGEIPFPEAGRAFFGQDAEYVSNSPKYKDNGDGTVTDLNTGLVWSKAVDKNKVSLIEAEKEAEGMTLGGYTDWRVPEIKELYSLIDFSGYTGGGDPSAMDSVPSNAVPFINTDYFDFMYGRTDAGERYIDAQWLTSTKYVSTTMDGNDTLFGVNFADGRIKGYGYKRPGQAREKKFYVRYVRGTGYGKNEFVDNGDETVTDRATGLMWMKADSGKAMRWKQALSYADEVEYAGYDDWRLPNAKELQYIVDYTRSPDTTNSPAIDPVFETTSIVNEDGEIDYPYFWTSTTHLDGPHPGSNAVYIAFGRALGKMHGKIMDVHGAGAQRSDPKVGNPGFRGPQGDAVRGRNFVRCVRGGNVAVRTSPPKEDKNKYPYNVPGYGEAGRAGGMRTHSRGVTKTGEWAGHDMNREEGMRHFPREEGFHFVERLDTDNDGKVSRDEFDGPPDAFDRHDADGDGYLSEKEAPKGPPPHGHRPGKLR